MIHENQVGVHVFELGVLFPQLAQLHQMRHTDARALALPLVVGRVADAVLPTRLVDFGAELNLFEDRDHLAFSESGFLHVETPLGGILYLRLAEVFESPRESWRLVGLSQATTMEV